MTFGKELHKNFQAQVSGTLTSGPLKEVDLFRCLIRAFMFIPGYKAAEIHGSRHLVEYVESENWFSRRPICELGDLLIIVFSAEKRQGRLLVMQNKVSRSGGQLSSSYRSFSANLVQYELLRNRPLFRHVTGLWKGRCNSLIQNTSYSSVCQYGLFYEGTNNHIDMASMTAGVLDFSSSAIRAKFPLHGRNPTARLAFSPSKYETFNRRNSADFEGADNLEDFGDLLHDLYFGRPICLSLKTQISFALMEHLRLNAGRASPLAEQLIREFSEIDFREDPAESNFHVPTGGNELPENIVSTFRALLLINADMCESNPFGNSQPHNLRKES